MTQDTALKITLYFCSNCLNHASVAACCEGDPRCAVQCVGLPCSGKLNLQYMIKAFETGADGVVVVACKAGDCTYLEGSPRAAKRAGAADRLLEEIGLGKGRVAFVELDHGDEPVLEEAFGRFADRLFQLCRKETGSREPVRSLPV